MVCCLWSLSSDCLFYFPLKTPIAAPTNTDAETKGPEVKDRASAKKSKGSSGSKAAEVGKAASGSGNDGVSQR